MKIISHINLTKIQVQYLLDKLYNYDKLDKKLYNYFHYVLKKMGNYLIKFQLKI